ncbi:MAG: copper resistance protein CopC [Caldilineaceae bacterium]|nr:copper resistance protein CopC [Caldilineaceae bacterium]MDE0338347.1 copper resistance protein CopC [Caldilineaceae bacterium]
MIAHQLRRGIAKLLWVALILVTIHYPLSIFVHAHADYDSSMPSAGEVVSQAPQQVQVWFTQELFRREGQNDLEVYGPDDQRVDQDDAAIDDDDRKLMSVSLQSDLPNGVYTVRWRTLSADDGDEADGEFQFTIQADEPAAETSPTTAPTPAPVKAQPPPTNTVESTETQAMTPPPISDSEDNASPPAPASQTEQGPGIPCLGSAAPALLLLGTVVLAGRRRRLIKRQTQGIWRNLSGENS